MSDSNKVHSITVILQVTPHADNRPGTFDPATLQEAIVEALTDIDVYVYLTDAETADDYVGFTVDADEVVGDLTPDTIPDALMGTPPVDWAGRTFGDLTPDEQRRAAQAAGTALTVELARFDQ